MFFVLLWPTVHRGGVGRGRVHGSGCWWYCCMDVALAVTTAVAVLVAVGFWC